MTTQQKTKVKLITFYDRPLRLWIAFYQDAEGNQIGDACYGPTKPSAIRDLVSTISLVEDQQ